MVLRFQIKSIPKSVNKIMENVNLSSSECNLIGPRDWKYFEYFCFVPLFSNFINIFDNNNIFALDKRRNFFIIFQFEKEAGIFRNWKMLYRLSIEENFDLNFFRMRIRLLLSVLICIRSINNSSLINNNNKPIFRFVHTNRHWNAYLISSSLNSGANEGVNSKSSTQLLPKWLFDLFYIENRSFSQWFKGNFMLRHTQTVLLPKKSNWSRCLVKYIIEIQCEHKKHQTKCTE